MRPFQSPKALLGRLDPESAAAIIAAAADIALLINPQGTILDFAAGQDLNPPIDGNAWIGRAWADTVTSESRPKVNALLDGKHLGASPRWRHINHPAPADGSGGDLPILYSTVRCSPLPAKAGEPMPGELIIAFGRDLRTTASLQQRLVDAQQAMEQDYRRLRDAQARYRVLFQASRDGLLVLDANSLRISEANASAERLLLASGRKLVGMSFPLGLDDSSQASVLGLLNAVRSGGRAAEVLAHLAPPADGQTGQAVVVSASAARLDEGNGLLVNLSPQGDAVAEGQRPSALMAQLVSAASDAMVVTNDDGQVQSANVAFVDLVQLGSSEQAHGQPLDRWLGRAGVDQNVLLANLKQRGSLRAFATSLRGEAGGVVDVEISANRIGQGENVAYGFVLRDVGRRLGPATSTVVQTDAEGKPAPRSAGELRELVGRVPLKNILGETTDLIEKMCIEAALELTRDNRASAAEMLGLSRQSLYVKLRRYGLGDLPSDETAG